MAFLIPAGTPKSYTPKDNSLWNGYELIESLTADGPLVHQQLIQDRLNLFKADELPIHILSVVTITYKSDAPMPAGNYLTTILFNVVGSSLVYPII
jgi:hypothetical protein